MVEKDNTPSLTDDKKPAILLEEIKSEGLKMTLTHFFEQTLFVAI